MKIVFLQDDFPPQSQGGAGFSTYELARGMHELGHEVCVITTCRDIKDAGMCTYEGISIYTIVSNFNPRWRAWRSIYNFSVVGQVRNIFKQVRPDIVHINNVHHHLSYHCFALARKYARGVVFTARDTMSVCYGKLDTERYLAHFDMRTTWRDHIQVAKKRYNPLYIFFARRYLAYADRRFAVSRSLAEALMANGVHNVEVLHTGARVEEWGAHATDIDTFRKRYSIENKKVIMFAGRISAGKGGEKILESFLRVCASESDAVLLIVGAEDESLRRLKSQMDQNVADRIVVTGWVDRAAMKVAYAVADVVVVPSLYLDPFPRTVIEAMASGKPVVGTCYGGAPEIIVDGGTGYVVNPLHTEDFAEKVLRIVQDSECAHRFGHAGYERIKNDFNLGEKVEQYLSIYRACFKKSE